MAIQQVLSLLLNAAGAVNSGTFVASLGGTYQLAAVATWGGASLQLQQLGPDSLTWIPLGTAVTTNGIQNIDVPAGARIRAAITGAGGTAIYASFSAVRQ